MIRTLRESNTVVLGVVFDAVLLPRHRTARVFFVDAVALRVVMVFLAVAGRICTVIGLPLTIPRVEGLSEFLQNALTGLTMQPLVFWMCLQLVFEVAVVGDIARVLPHVAGVIVGDVPEFAGRPPMPVERFSYLGVVADFRSMGAVDLQHLYACIITYTRVSCKYSDWERGISCPSIDGGLRRSCRIHPDPKGSGILLDFV